MNNTEIRDFIENAVVEAINNPNKSPKEILDDAVAKGNQALKQSR